MRPPAPSVTVAPCTTPEAFQKGLVIWHYFGSEASAEDATRFAQILPPDRLHVATEDGRAVGGAGAFPFTLSVPGGHRIPAGGVTVVGVLPTHRRRGVLTALMRTQLDDFAARGESVAWLWASEATIYGRFGYGLASYAASVSVERNKARFAHDSPVSSDARLVETDTALQLFPAIYDRVAQEIPGFASRSPAWWSTRRLADPPERRGGAGVLERVLFTRDGTPVGYALYRINQKWAHGMSNGSVRVVEALGVDDPTTRDIWHFLSHIDLLPTIEASLLPVDHPLLRLVAEPGHLHWRVSDALFVRLVDVGAALSARGYAPGSPVVFDVTDSFRPQNSGRWALVRGSAARTDLPAGLALDVAALGSVYLGGVTFRQLARAGEVTERLPGALAAADQVFATDRAPWCPEIF